MTVDVRLFWWLLTQMDFGGENGKGSGYTLYAKLKFIASLGGKMDGQISSRQLSELSGWFI